MRSIVFLVCLLALAVCVASSPLNRIHSGAHAHSNGGGAVAPSKPHEKPQPPQPHQPEHKPEHQPEHKPEHKPVHPKPVHPKPVHPKPTPPPAPKPHDGSSCSFNGFTGTCQSVSSCGGTSIANHCPGGNDIQCCINQGHFAAGCGKAAIERAMTWVNMELQYCQSANGQPDGDSDCSSVCHRAINKKWDAYRSDCSAFVSYAYGLPAPGRVTSEFAPYNTDISYSIEPSELSSGDAINSVPDEHIMLFVRWLNSEHTSAELLEEPGCSASPPHARVTQSDVRITDGKLFVAANGMTFQPIRFRSNSPTC